MVDPPTPELLVARAREGDRHAFGLLVAPQRVAVFRHCYRMLGSGPDAEDAVQDTLLRAFRAIGTFDGRGAFAGWLYRIATNVCLDRLRSARSRSHPVLLGPAVRSIADLRSPVEDMAWVEPVADSDLAADPLDTTVARETIALAFVASVQRLPPRQRAALLLHDVLGFTPAEVAEVLSATPASVNSLLHRAREAASTIQQVVTPPSDDPRLADLVRRYVGAWETANLDAFLSVVTDDIAFSMPPLAQWFLGRSDVGAFVEAAIFTPARPHGVPMRVGRCNGQIAIAVYAPDADGVLRASGLQVLDTTAGEPLLVRSITSYRSPELVERIGLPGTLS